jgi:uncharacterized phage protein gp47/JayE
MISITDAGLEKNSLEENLEYAYVIIRGEKGPGVDLSPTGPWGQIAAILAKFMSDNDDEQEEIYLSRDPDNATGVAQDKLSAETGTFRKEATKTVVEDVLLLGDEGTLIVKGAEVTQAPEFESAAGLTFVLSNNVTISKSFARKVLYSLDTPVLDLVYAVTINSVIYSYTALVSDTKALVIDGLIALIVAGTSTVVGSNDGNDQLILFGDDLDFTIDSSYTLTLEELHSAGDFSASVVGANIVTAGSLTEIVTPVTGWLSVTNPNSGIIGEERETDTELIIRRKNELVKGKGTDTAIQNAVNQVDNVTAGAVVSNRTAGVVDGIPAKSFETIVTGGIDNDIAQAIFDNVPSGIEPFGTETGIAIDQDGAEHTIGFSRTTTTYIHVRYTRVQHPEESFPANGSAIVRQNLLDWASDNISQGVDVVRQRLETPFFEVPGSQSVVTEFAETPAPGDTPAWTTDPIISVAARDIAQFAEDRIFIVLV